MMQEIYPKKLDNSYDPNAVILDDDYVFIFEKGEFVFKNDKRECFKYRDTKRLFGDTKYTYLFKIDDTRFFLASGVDVRGHKTRTKAVKVRYMETQWLAFAISCGSSLAYWYSHTRHCGRCGARNEHSKTERAMVCPRCGNTIYPIISPAVIVALTDGDRLLLTRYAHGPYKRYALIAGYTEIGETVEETVIREVMEETGLKVKNIRYYGSQPWPFSGSVLMGYFAELDGSDEIIIDRSELSEAVWKHRDEIEVEENPRSLTNTMIKEFKEQV